MVVDLVTDLREAEAKLDRRLHTEAVVEAAVAHTMVTEAEAHRTAAAGKAAALHGHMMRQSHAAQGAGQRVEDSVRILEQAKRETDAVESAVETLSSELSRLQETARTKTLDYARAVENSGAVTSDMQRLTSALQKLEGQMADTLESVQQARAAAGQQRCLSEDTAAGEVCAAQAEADVVAEMARAEAEVTEVVQRMRVCEVDHAQSQGGYQQLLAQIGQIAESSGTKKAQVAHLQKELQATLATDEAARMHHAEAQRAVSAASALVTQHDTGLAEAEIKLQELQTALRAQEQEVARQRDLSVKAKVELSQCKQGERVSSETSLAAQQAVHRAEDALSAANLEFEGVLKMEAEAYSSLEPAQAQAAGTGSVYTEASIQYDIKRQAAAVVETSLCEARANAAAAAARAAKERALSAELEGNLKIMEGSLRQVSEDTEETRAKLSGLTASSESIAQQEVRTCQELSTVKQAIAEVAQSLLEAEELLSKTQAAERAVSAEYVSRCRDYELQDQLLQQAAESARVSRNQRDVATHAVDRAARSLSQPRALSHSPVMPVLPVLPVPVPVPVSVSALAHSPGSHITSPTRLPLGGIQ